MTRLDFQFIIIITVTIQNAVSNQFSWNFMVGASPHIGEPYFFWKQSSKTTDMGENVPLQLFFWLSFSRYGVLWGKNFKAVFSTEFPPPLRVIFAFVVRHPIPRKTVVSPKNYFSLLFWKILFFLEKIIIRKLFKTSFLKKKFILIFVARHTLILFSSKWSCPPINDFSQFFQHKLKSILKVFLLESIFTWKKILWWINFVLIKFSPNALLFKKLQNECKNPTFLHYMY